jgi:hypothetical protein
LESLLVSSALGIGCLLAGLGGLALRPRLSEHHLDDESRGVVSNITGLIAAMAALLLGLLVASAQSSYNTVNDEVDQLAANLVELDRTLDALGPATADITPPYSRSAAWMPFRATSDDGRAASGGVKRVPGGFGIC